MAAVRLNTQLIFFIKRCNNLSQFKRALAVSIIAFLCSFSALSQQIQQLKLGESHKQIDVYSISEDQNGYLWLGTLDGLYRYDGKSFIGYHANASEPEHLSNNLARIVFTSSLGDLWIGTQRGLNRYIPDKDGFKQYLNADINSREMGEVIWGIFESPTQELLISTDVNLYRWDANADQLIPLLTPGSPATEIKSLVFTSERQVLAATYEQGLFFVELDTGQISPHPQNPHLKKEGLLLYQISAPHHNMRWLNTNKGSYQLSSETWQVSPEPMALANKAVRGMLQAGDETLWVGTEQGIFIQNRNEHYQLVKPQQGSEASPHIYVLYKDKYGNIWAGGRSFIGLHHASSDPFEHLPVNTAEEPQQANIVALESTAARAWLLTQQGVLIFWDSVTEQLIELGKLPSETTLTASSRLSLSANKMNLWISTFNGLISYHLANKKLEKHLITINGVALEGNFDYQQDVHGQIWIASKNFGLLRYQPDSGQTLQFLPPLNELGKPHRLNTLTMNHKGDIWLGSEEGLLLFSAENKSFSQVNMGQSLWISSLAETDHGIWLGTLLNGLFFLDASTGTVTNYRSEDGLTDNGICDIIPLADHNTWVATNYGISYVAASSHKIRSFNRSSDIENVEFNQHAGSLSPTGTLYFGGTNGFTRFKPESIKPINYQGKVHLKTLRVFNQEVRPNGVHQRLTASIDSLRPIQLLHDDSPFSIEFGYPSPAHLETIAYSYRLVGQDHQWLTADSHSALATYTNICPGTYLFEVQAASKNDLWKSEITRVTIHVAPPLWQTVWAYVVYAALLACLLWFIRRYMGQRQQAQQRVIESEERLKLSLWGSGDELWDWQIDTGKIYRSNIWGLLEFPHDGRRSSQYGEQSNIHPKDLERVQKALNRHFDGDTTYYEATYRVRNKSSEWLWILDRGKIVSRDENNIPLRMTGTIKDISKLKQAEQRLTLFARSIANISDGVFILNRRFRIVEINDAFSVISGFTKSQIINRSLRFRSYPPQFTEQVKMKLAQQGR